MCSPLDLPDIGAFWLGRALPHTKRLLTGLRCGSSYKRRRGLLLSFVVVFRNNTAHSTFLRGHRRDYHFFLKGHSWCFFPPLGLFYKTAQIICRQRMLVQERSEQRFKHVQLHTFQSSRQQVCFC